ncbi:hypothetical protein ACU5AX_13410 [Sphingomonas sp. XXL09]|uniref:hypothetical protein n=1 Tax=Sphingomonas sp. XXL09 TaxID=3457787 RepID=UPI00406BAD6B
MFRTLILGALLVTAPVAAQTQTSNPADQPSTPLPYDPGHDSNSARSNAIAAQTAPGVAAANQQSAAQAQVQADAATAVNLANSAEYQADLRRYRASMRMNRRIAAADAALQADRERAYAMAMADWRAQVAACKRGHTRACNMPSPDPQNYM